jgi:FKBP-type peptidyl-prolyl cis-trans isomerase
MRFLRIGIGALVLGLLASQVFAAELPVLKSQKDKEAYAVGVDLAKNLRRQGIDMNADATARGLRDGLAGTTLLMTEVELRTALNTFQTELKQKRARTLASVAEDNRKAGEAFLAANKTKEGVIVLPSGLQYKIIEAGDGRKPTDTDTVEVHYRGTLIDQTEFDSSFSRGKPATFKVDGLISGWKEALKLMTTGSKWQVFIPSQLAYGEKGSGRYIGPNATLIFELELLAIR